MTSSCTSARSRAGCSRSWARRRRQSPRARSAISLSRPARRAQPAGGTPTLGDSEHAHRPASIAGRAVRLIRTAGPPGVDVLCEATDTTRVREALDRGGGTARERGGRRDRAGRARAAPLRGGSRRHRHPPGGGLERARRELHQGLLRRAGDGRAPVLQGQAQPPPARPAPVRAARPAARSCASASAPWVASQARSSHPSSARSRSRWCAGRPSRARPSASAPTAPAPRSPSCPSRPERVARIARCTHEASVMLITQAMVAR